MKKQNLIIVDTGCANIASIYFALQRLDCSVSVSHNSNEISNADKLILPGVGTAEEAMKNLTQYHLIEILKKVEQPLLGICLGMQLLGLRSEEGKKKISCLKKIPVETKRLESGACPLPHMGWNQIIRQESHPLFFHIPAQSYFYFVHSYGVPVGKHTLASCYYNILFSAAVQNENYFGVQFHPERSGETGAQLLKNFLEI